MPLLLILAAFGLGFAVSRAQRHGHAIVPQPPQLPAGAPYARGTLPVAASSPIAVLGMHLRAGEVPPPTVLMCAIAEAETNGNYDLADDIMRTFIEPVVRANALAAARDANPRAAAASPAPAPAPAIEVVEVAAKAQPITDDDIAAAYAAMGMPGHVSAPTHVAASDSVVVSGRMEMRAPQPSPIRGVDGERWSRFVGQVAREAPTFATPRHVGQFRQRRERLIEIGFDPAAVLASTEAQLAALEADMRDAFQHARDGGLTDHVGAPVAVRGEQHELTLSGLLGVIQAAGLEGASNWIDQPADRDRFPHTTAAFVRCNGVF